METTEPAQTRGRSRRTAHSLGELVAIQTRETIGRHWVYRDLRASLDTARQAFDAMQGPGTTMVCQVPPSCLLVMVANPSGAFTVAVDWVDVPQYLGMHEFQEGHARLHDAVARGEHAVAVESVLGLLPVEFVRFQHCARPVELPTLGFLALYDFQRGEYVGAGVDLHLPPSVRVH